MSSPFTIRTTSRGLRLNLYALLEYDIVNTREFKRQIKMESGTNRWTQGSAKSSLMESVKTLVDPSIIKTLSFPRDKNELIQQLSHNCVAYYDNISKLSDWISDEL
jgi:hypothetical protein